MIRAFHRFCLFLPENGFPLRRGRTSRAPFSLRGRTSRGIVLFCRMRSDEPRVWTCRGNVLFLRMRSDKPCVWTYRGNVFFLRMIKLAPESPLSSHAAKSVAIFFDGAGTADTLSPHRRRAAIYIRTEFSRRRKNLRRCESKKSAALYARRI